MKEEIYLNEKNRKGFLVPDENRLVIPTGNSIETVDLARDAVKARWAVQDTRLPSAFFCCNDWMANGAISALKNLGVSVPADVSIIGFDNIVISQITEPKLTTVDQGMFRLGQGAAQLLLELIEGKDRQGSLKKIILETKLIKRASVAELSKKKEAEPDEKNKSGLRN